MSLTVVKGLQSEIFVPVTPPPVWAPVKKELKDMTIALATAAGVHHKDQKRFNLAGDFTWRKITDKMPSLFIGATLGSFMSTILAAPTDICAACGMVGVFCAVTNSPITSLLIAAELFGFNGMPFYCIVVAVSYLLSGYYSLYKEQKIVYYKTENKYVDKHTK